MLEQSDHPHVVNRFGGVQRHIKVELNRIDFTVVVNVGLNVLRGGCVFSRLY